MIKAACLFRFLCKSTVQLACACYLLVGSFFCCDHCPGSCGGLLCQAVVKALEDLTEQNKVREKVYGKQKVYMVCQVMAMHFMFLAIAVVCMIV